MQTRTDSCHSGILWLTLHMLLAGLTTVRSDPVGCRIHHGTKPGYVEEQKPKTKLKKKINSKFLRKKKTNKHLSINPEMLALGSLALFFPPFAI